MCIPKEDDAMHNIYEQARTENTFLPGPMYDSGVRVSQEHILCSVLAFLKIDGAVK
jgi:hypothetical protein